MVLGVLTDVELVVLDVLGDVELVGLDVEVWLAGLAVEVSLHGHCGSGRLWSSSWGSM